MKKRRILAIIPALALFVFVFIQYVDVGRAQTNPFKNPALPAPSGIIKPFLDTSADEQTKAGSLTIDGTAPIALCLGGNNNPGSLCPSDTEGQTNNYIRLNGADVYSLGTPVGAMPLELTLPDDNPPYVRFEGFSSVTARISQQWALFAQGNGGLVTTWRSGFVGDAGFHDNDPTKPPSYGIRGEATVNKDNAYAIYGLDEVFDKTEPSNNSSAAKFEGKVGIAGDVFIGDPLYRKQICLNGQDTGNCIYSWDPEGQGFEFVQLQMNGVLTTAQPGSVVVRGNAQMNSLISGPIINIPTSYTEGDGSCNNGEAPGSPDCSI